MRSWARPFPVLLSGKSLRFKIFPLTMKHFTYRQWISHDMPQKPFTNFTDETELFYGVTTFDYDLSELKKKKKKVTSYSM